MAKYKRFINDPLGSHENRRQSVIKLEMGAFLRNLNARDVLLFIVMSAKINPLAAKPAER